MFYMNFLSKRWFWSGIQSLRRPTDEISSAVIMMHVAVLYLAGSHNYLTSRVRSP